MPPQACHGVAGGEWGRAPWVTGIGNLEIRPRDEGERLKNGTHACSEESAVLKAASLLEGRPLRPGSPSRSHRNHLPFSGHLRPGAEPRVPAGSGKTCTPGPETVCPEGRKPAGCEDRAGHLGSSSQTYHSDLITQLTRGPSDSTPDQCFSKLPRSSKHMKVWGNVTVKRSLRRQ